MENYQKRVIEEKKELDIKIEKLDSFLCNSNIGKAETKIMRIQHLAMRQYSFSLGQRIELFV